MSDVLIHKYIGLYGFLLKISYILAIKPICEYAKANYFGCILASKILGLATIIYNKHMYVCMYIKINCRPYFKRQQSCCLVSNISPKQCLLQHIYTSPKKKWKMLSPYYFIVYIFTNKFTPWINWHFVSQMANLWQNSRIYSYTP